MRIAIDLSLFDSIHPLSLPPFSPSATSFFCSLPLLHISDTVLHSPHSFKMLRPTTIHRISNLPLSTTTFTRRAFSVSPRPNIARATIVGPLGAEPERTNTSTGKDIVKYVVGSNYGSRENQKTSWFRITCFDDNESRIQYMTGLQKG